MYCCVVNHGAGVYVFVTHASKQMLSWSSLVLQVTSMARQMVVNYGFSDIGPWNLQVGAVDALLEWWQTALPASLPH